MKSGRLRRHENTIYLESTDGKKPIPVEDVEAFYLFGEIDLNTKLLVFLAQKGIPLHLFNYYGFYSGSYYPREYLNSGFLVVKQVEHYTDPHKRLFLAREFVATACDNILRNLKYYRSRKEGIDRWIEAIEQDIEQIGHANDVPTLMGIEGRVREKYYKAFNDILSIELEFTTRVKRPPDNMINALISFGNSILYTTTLSEIYHTQLIPTVSFLHEPGTRRFSLSLDISEIFKPIIVDRLIFKLINNQMLQERHFQSELNFCYLKEDGRRIFIQEYEEKLRTTIMHRKLNRKVSYQRLIRLECYKLIKHLSGIEPYKGFRMWW